MIYTYPNFLRSAVPSLIQKQHGWLIVWFTDETILRVGARTIMGFLQNPDLYRVVICCSENLYEQFNLLDLGFMHDDRVYFVLPKDPNKFGISPGVWEYPNVGFVPIMNLKLAKSIGDFELAIAKASEYWVNVIGQKIINNAQA